jgi:hypothetical protein
MLNVIKGSGVIRSLKLGENHRFWINMKTCDVATNTDGAHCLPRHRHVFLTLDSRVE